VPTAVDTTADVNTSDADGAAADITPDGPVDSGCEGDGTRTCYSGAVATKGVGQCKGGTQQCIDGNWDN